LGKLIFIILPLVVKYLSMLSALRVMDALEVIDSWLENKINWKGVQVLNLFMYFCAHVSLNLEKR